MFNIVNTPFWPNVLSANKMINIISTSHRAHVSVALSFRGTRKQTHLFDSNNKIYEIQTQEKFSKVF